MAAPAQRRAIEGERQYFTFPTFIPHMEAEAGLDFLAVSSKSERDPRMITIAFLYQISPSGSPEARIAVGQNLVYRRQRALFIMAARAMFGLTLGLPRGALAVSVAAIVRRLGSLQITEIGRDGCNLRLRQVVRNWFHNS